MGTISNLLDCCHFCNYLLNYFDLSVISHAPFGALANSVYVTLPTSSASILPELGFLILVMLPLICASMLVQS